VLSGWRFAQPEYFNLLILVPIYWGLVKWTARRKQARLKKAFGDKNYAVLASSFDARKANWKLRFETFVLVFLVLALARPQTEGGKQKVRNEGVEILLAVDVSNSMLAEDVKPSRLEVAKRELSRLVDLSAGDRFGLIAFAGSAVLLSPMTTDKDALRMYLESLSPEMVSSQGTDFTKAIEMAAETLRRGGVEGDADVAVTRAVVLVSDGESHQETAQKFVDELVKTDVRIFSIAVGTEKGAPIPVKDAGGQIRGYLNDRSGKTVLTQLKDEALKDLAERGKGSFYHFSFNQDVIQSLRQDLGQLQKAKFSDGEITTFDERFQFFLLLAFFFGVLTFWIGERKAPGRLWRGRFEVGIR